MSRSGKILRAYTLSGLFLLTGMLLSLRFGEWNWFARSGSLVVVIGILLTSWQLIENARRLGVRFHESRHDWAEETESRKKVRKHIRDEAAWQHERSGLYLLVIGTLVWGLGDLLNLL